MLTAMIVILAALGALSGCLLGGCFGNLSFLWVLPLSFLGGVLLWGLLAFLFLLIACATVDFDRPQENDSKLFRWIVRMYPHPVLTVLLTTVHTRGLEKTPKGERFLLVCNHLNDLDPVVLLGYFRDSQLAFITKRENMSMFIVGKVMHKIQCQPLNRENDREALKTILKCIQLIKDDKASVAVFPEGYTSMDGLLHHFRSGVFKIAMKAKVPVVVCTLQNTKQPFRNAPKLKRSHVHLHLLDVIRPHQFEGMTATELGDMVHQMMAQDLGPDLVAPQ